MDIVETVASLDDTPELHAARILVLLAAFSGEDGTDAIEGLTKLAKLDFLLRYPVMLDRALRAKGYSTRDVDLQDHEQISVESEMVRYRFGPWDHRYREILNVLVARGLASISIEGRTVVVAPTAEGHRLGAVLASDPVFEAYAKRSQILKRHFDLTATNLMRFIYDTFPEVVSLRSNEAIPT